MTLKYPRIVQSSYLAIVNLFRDRVWRQESNDIWNDTSVVLKGCSVVHGKYNETSNNVFHCLPKYGR